MCILPRRQSRAHPARIGTSRLSAIEDASYLCKQVPIPNRYLTEVSEASWYASTELRTRASPYLSRLPNVRRRPAHPISAAYLWRDKNPRPPFSKMRLRKPLQEDYPSPLHAQGVVPYQHPPSSLGAQCCGGGDRKSWRRQRTCSEWVHHGRHVCLRADLPARLPSESCVDCRPEAHICFMGNVCERGYLRFFPISISPFRSVGCPAACVRNRDVCFLHSVLF